MCACGQVGNALDWAATNASLPVHFYTDDDALTEAGEPRYANVRAVLAVVPGKCEYRDSSRLVAQNELALKAKEEIDEETGANGQGNAPLMTYRYEFDAQLLAAFAASTVAMINDETNGNEAFLEFLNTALADAGVEDVAAVQAYATLSI